MIFQPVMMPVRQILSDLLASRPLPVDGSLESLAEALGARAAAVLSAAPAAGKTTRVPLALLASEWLGNRKILVLEPRRLAAQRATHFVAEQLGERPGDTVGYRIRGDSRVGPRTRIEVVTEGILTRMIQDDPSLEAIGLLIFDEFHERSIHADLGLALALDVQARLRPDLRILVMSATLDGVALARVLGDVPVVASTGRSFPVTTRHRSFPLAGPVEPAVADTITRALGRDAGDILVFLPGQREIRRVEELLLSGQIPEDVAIHTLFSEAQRERQQAALAPAPAGVRKVILSTSIAETSLTIDGVRVVIDAGLARVAHFDPHRGMEGLVTVPVSRATADQRRGRAGRQAPGVCYRLWTEAQEQSLPPYPTPELLTADLTPLALELARWGSPDGSKLRFIDVPPPAHLQQARATLRDLGAVDEDGALTVHGRQMSRLPVHPRLAHMLIHGATLGMGPLACDVAALLEERDLLRGNAARDADLLRRLHALAHGGDVDRPARERALAESRRLRGTMGVRDDMSATPDSWERDVGRLVALAYPDRVARRRGPGTARYQTSGGSGAVLPEGSALGRQEFLALADVDGIGTEVRVYLAAGLSRDDFLALFAHELVEEDDVRWAPEAESVLARRLRRFRRLVVDERSIRPEGERVLAAMLDGIRQLGLESLPWDQPTLSFRARSEWLRVQGLAGADWPDLSDGHLAATLASWLGPHVRGMERRAHLAQLRLLGILQSLFTRGQLRQLDGLAPAHLTLPTGSRAGVVYAPDTQPVLAVRLQELFGQTDTPSVAGGRVKVLIHLLSPAGRPLAVTQDLKSFWKNAYPDVRKEMRGRYPKHDWPEDPLSAAPTRRARRKR